MLWLLVVYIGSLVSLLVTSLYTTDDVHRRTSSRRPASTTSTTLFTDPTLPHGHLPHPRRRRRRSPSSTSCWRCRSRSTWPRSPAAGAPGARGGRGPAAVGQLPRQGVRWRAMLDPAGGRAARRRSATRRASGRRHGDRARLPLAAVHGHADLRRARAAAELAARRRRPISGAKAGRTFRSVVLPAARARRSSAGVDLHVLAVARRLHHRADRGRQDADSSATSSTATSAPATCPLAAAFATVPVVIMVVVPPGDPPHRRAREPLMLVVAPRHASLARRDSPRSCWRSSTCRSSSSPCCRSARRSRSSGRRRASRLDWWRRASSEPRAPATRSCTSVKIALVRHRHRARARQRWRRSPCSASGSSAATRCRSSSCCRSRCPASSPASRSTPAFQPGRDHARLLTLVVAHATFCIVVVYNNVVARLRRLSPNVDEASADLGADMFQTFRYVTFPLVRSALLAGGLLGVRAVVRRDRRDDLHRGPGHARRCRSGSSTTCSARTSCPTVNVVAVVVIVLSIVPVYLAQRLTTDPTGGLAGSAEG